VRLDGNQKAGCGLSMQQALEVSFHLGQVMPVGVCFLVIETAFVASF